jgi:hypothetical protein
MNLTITLNESDLEDLLQLYNKIKPHLRRIAMEESVYELNCEHCGNEWELSFLEDDDSDEPLYCPFCGCDVDLSDIEDDSYIDERSDFDVDDLDFGKR